MTTMTQREKERLQAQLDAIHSRIPAEQAAKLLELRKSLPPGPTQPPLPGVEEWVR